jgi:hypothetical protein
MKILGVHAIIVSDTYKMSNRMDANVIKTHVLNQRMKLLKAVTLNVSSTLMRTDATGIKERVLELLKVDT